MDPKFHTVWDTLEPWTIIGIGVAALSLVLQTMKVSDSRGESEEEAPEFLNFKVDQYAIDRMRDPTLPPIIKKPADQTEREHWLRNHAIRNTWIRWGRIKRLEDVTLVEDNGFFCEYYNVANSAYHSRECLQDFASLGYEVRGLDTVNLPSFQGLRVNNDLCCIERIWSKFPACQLALRRMGASHAQLAQLAKTLHELHQLGLRVETLPVWLLLQQKDGEFFIPHLPQRRQDFFPCNLQLAMMRRGDDDFPAHLLGPEEEVGGHRAFQFHLASLIWRLLSGEWPYDKEPLLFRRGENPNRMSHDFGGSLTPVLLRMTSLDPQERYDELGAALEELAEALA